jgi:hypothetical protein
MSLSLRANPLETIRRGPYCTCYAQLAATRLAAFISVLRSDTAKNSSRLRAVLHMLRATRCHMGLAVLLVASSPRLVAL